MKNIYLAAYKDFSDYRLLEKVLNYMLSNTKKEDVVFFVSNGETGDNTCFKYVLGHEYKYVDWCSDKFGNRAKQKLPYIQKSTHSVLVTDGESKGISIALMYSAKYVNGKIVLIKPKENVFSVWENGELIAERPL